ncbi:response regulator [Lysobacter sp. TY2-98]|uniref:ATP-binding protein n=1 Tax=Lysobacter sp. TY2-98 TaxID=2290922 RepID=UPI000E1FB53B|nr:ATP-binding protein [Lysobacter sp. TY2-98]AXK73209.1 response regulator [Lysobacter sp. TY2-98]
MTPNASAARAMTASDASIRRQIAECDWASTPLGPVAAWPRSLKTVVELMLDSRFAMWLAWGDDLTFFCNDAYRPTLGVKRDFIGASAREVWKEIWPDIGPRIEHVLRTGEATWDEGLELYLERRGFKEESYHTFSYSPVQGDTGRIEGMLCVVTEVTERTLAERRMATIAAMSSHVMGARTVDDACARAVETLASASRDVPFVAIYRLEGGIARRVAATRAAAAPIEMTTLPADVTRLIELHHAGVVDAFEGLLPASSEWGDPVERAYVVPLRRAPQDERASVLFVAGLSPRLVLDGEYERFLQLAGAQVANATADAAAFEDQARRAEQLAELDRAKTAFFSNVSHELRTPLTLILSPLDELESHVDTDARELLHTARRNGRRLQRLVNTLLDFSRIEAGRMEANFQRLDAAAYTQDLASMFRSAVERAGIDFDIRVMPVVEPVYLDRRLWEKVVFNLLSNAFKFTLAGRITVEVIDRGPRFELVVSDTGGGIPLDAQARLFERFYRVEGARGRSIEGSGIGLALVQELVRLHGGQVGVHSVPGQGSRFTVSIPTGRAHLPDAQVGERAVDDAGGAWTTGWLEELEGWLDTAAAVSPEAPRASGIGADPTTRYRVLVVDDNADMRAYLERLLTPLYDVVTCANGLDALAQVHARRPDLILSDVMMPGIDGFELLRRLRDDDDTAALPLILLSARAGEEARLEGLQAGADDYLTKPFQARELIARVQGVLQLAHARGEIARANEALRDSESRHRLLAQLADHAQTLDDPHELLTQSVALLGRHLGLDRCTFCKVDEAQGVVEVLGGFVSDPALDTLEGRWRLADFGIDQVEAYRAGRPFVVDDVHADPRLRDVAKAYAALDIIAHVSVGLVVDGRLVAVIAAHQRVPRRWTESDVHLVEAVAVRCWEALQRLDAQRALTEALTELRVADRRKNEFLATLAHELRNPLAPLRTAITLLEHDAPSVTPARLHGMMRRQVDHLVRLVDDLLEVARISQGKIELKRERITVQAIVDAAVEAARPVIEAQGHRLGVQLPPLPPISVNGDPVRLTQILVNLLNNAAKYTAPGGDIALAVMRDGADVAIEVRDTGIGIEPELLPQLFDLFVQGRHIEGEAMPTGLGIGLALVKQLVELHGGQVGARSDGIGRGSVFRVTLPTLAWTDAPAAYADVPTASADASALRVMVCDDNRDAADSLRMLLECSVDEVGVAYGGSPLLAAVEARAPDLVFLDLGMPPPDGYAVARELRARFGTTMTLVALTGWGQAEDRERTAAAGFDMHLVKPVDVPGLEQALALARSNRRPATHS